MIPALDPESESDSQLFGDSGSGYEIQYKAEL